MSEAAAAAESTQPDEGTSAPPPAAAPDPGGGAEGPAPSRGKRSRFGLTGKIVATAAISIALVAVILAASFARDVRGLLQDELGTRGRMAALALANTATTLVLSQDVTGLEALAAATLSDVPGSAYVIVRDESGRTLAHATQASLGEALAAAPDLAALGLGERLLEHTVRLGREDVLELAALVTFKGKADVQYLDPLGLAPAAGAGDGRHEGARLGADRVPARGAHGPESRPRAAARSCSPRSRSPPASS